MKKRHIAFFTIILFSFSKLFALDFSDIYAQTSDFMDFLYDENQGLTVFRSLLIPIGGKAEAMGSAFTAIADDASFFEYNPAGSADLDTTQLAFFHNSWIADSNLETVAYTSRYNNFGYGGMFRCFYVPFTEYNTFGERVSKGYYTESVMALNASYTFFPGYYFNGVSAGISLKGAFRSVPDYASNAGSVQEGSGLTQSAFAAMIDTGIQVKFNLLKVFHSREKNAAFGLALRNLGFPVRGEPLPTVAAIGMSWKPVNPTTISVELQQPLNLVDISKSELITFGAGVDIKFVDFFSFQAGLFVKGANPRFSIGGQVLFKGIQYNLNYTLDMTSTSGTYNRISLAAKLSMGDQGRSEKQKQVDALYTEALSYYSKGEMERAIELWNQVLEINPYFDPATEGIEAASLSIELSKKIEDVQRLE